MNPPTPRRPNLVLTLVVHAVAWALLAVALLVLAPRQEAEFRRFNMALPAVTVAVLRCSEWAVRFAPVFGIALAILLTADGVVLYLLNRGERSRRLAWQWAAAWLLVPLALAVAVALAIGIPFTRLVEGLGK
jgi:type II secretory pathway component PulF